MRLSTTAVSNFRLGNTAVSAIYLGTTKVWPLGGFDISNAVYDNVSFIVSGQESDPSTLAFSATGTRFYVLGIGDTVYQYNMTTPWVVSTASYSGNSLLLSGQDIDAFGISFSPDGTRMYMVGVTGDRVHQYSLSTAWEISTASYTGNSFSVAVQDGVPAQVILSPDGVKMMVLGRSNSRVYQYTLSTPWNVSTASYDNVSFLVSGQEANPFGLNFSPAGTKMFIIGQNNDRVYQYTLATPWNVGTASYDNVSFLVSGQDSSPRQVAFKTDGAKMYVIGISSDRVYQYSLN